MRQILPELPKLPTPSRRIISRRAKEMVGAFVACLAACFYSLPQNYNLNTVQAQTCTTCTNPPLLGQGYTFPQNTDITVNISGSFNDTEFGCIRQAFLNWQANSSTGSGVRYVQITHGGSPVGGANTIQVWRERPPLDANGQQPQADMTPTFNSTNTNLSSAVIRVHPDVNNCTALAEAMAHELGHTYGLDDCPTCCPNTSTMTGYNSMNDVASGTTSPSTCDANAARQAGNYNLGTARGPQPRESNNGGYGGGYNNQGFTGYYGTYNRACYAAFMVTNYYACGSSGCSYMYTTVSYMGTYCY